MGNKFAKQIDGLEAVQQAAWLTINTERYEYTILSHDYGTEMRDLIGKSRNYVSGDIERRITEALLQDDRILEVRDFDLRYDRENAYITLTVISEFGEFPLERSVNLG